MPKTKKSTVETTPKPQTVEDLHQEFDYHVECIGREMVRMDNRYRKEREDFIAKMTADNTFERALTWNSHDLMKAETRLRVYHIVSGLWIEGSLDHHWFNLEGLKTRAEVRLGFANATRREKLELLETAVNNTVELIHRMLRDHSSSSDVMRDAVGRVQRDVCIEELTGYADLRELQVTVKQMARVLLAAEAKANADVVFGKSETLMLG